MRPLLRFLACVTLAALGHAAQAAAGEASSLAPGVWWLPGEFVAGSQPDSNSVLIEAPDGLLVFDTGRSAPHAQRLLQAIKARKAPLAVIVNSHWHLDHIGGNGPLKQGYPAAKVVASNAIVDARKGFLANYHQQIEERLSTLPAEAAERNSLTHELEIIDRHEASTPDVAVQGTGRRQLAGREFLVGLAAPAATAGDVWLYDPRAKVLASGDLVTLPAPLFDTACPAQWSNALDALAGIDFDWLVPGHGAPMRRTGFEIYRKAYRGLLKCAASSAERQQCVDGWMAEAASLIPSQDDKLARGLLGYYVDNVLRQPEAQHRAGCPAG